MSAWGQPEKGSRPAYVFRNAIDSCRKRAAPALTYSAGSGHSPVRSRTAGIDPQQPTLPFSARSVVGKPALISGTADMGAKRSAHGPKNEPASNDSIPPKRTIQNAKADACK